ncbi:MAG: hypothetical protein J6S49_07935 [Erysipelotrichaceae bacterium]|nr:hypothetical protein [Erysipelotrichaceae bacterium]
MKLIKKILGFLSLAGILGGAGSLAWQYFRNKQLLEVLVSNSIVKGSISVLQKMGISIVVIFVGMMFLSAYFKVGSIVRRIEREKQEAIWQERKESEERNEQLRREAEELRAEAEKAKMENELMKKTFMKPAKDDAEMEALNEGQE